MTTKQIFAYGTTASVQLVAHWCNGCGMPYGLPEGFLDDRRKDHKSWTCPNGCVRHYPAGKSDEQKLREAEVRETALRDQLRAAIRDAEGSRSALMRDRGRIANGVCPCCNKKFPNVRRHMSAEHPEYAVDHGTSVAAPGFECSCGLTFDTYLGLRIHQGKNRPGDWDKPKGPKWRSHLTVVS